MRGFGWLEFTAFSALLTTAIAGVACDPEDTHETTGGSSGETTTTVECAVNETLLPDGRCQPPGLPLDMPCPPGEMPLESGTCQPAGVPSDQCGDGFEADGKGGCQPILPSQNCPDGSMAIPGETQCRDVAPCGNGTWGQIPVEADTQFVDGSYAGQDSDGSQNKPWNTIQAGVDAAADGAVVAIAAGVYTENLTIAPNSPVKLWGRCPSMVTVEGTAGPNTPAIVVLADDAEIHNLAITGNGLGAAVAASNVLVEKVHVRDTVSVGIVADSADLRVKGSLFERTHRAAVFVQSGSNVVVETSMMTDCLALANGTMGRAIETVSGPGENTLTVESCLLQRSNDAAISTADTTLTMDRTAVRDTLPIAGNDSSFGVGVSLYQSTFTISHSTVERVHTSGLEIVQSKGTVENSTVKDVFSVGDPQIVYTGIRAVSPNSVPTELTLKSSTISGAPQTAVMVYKSTAVLEGALVYNNMVDLAHARGAPIVADTGSITVRYSVLTENWGGGLLIRRGSGWLDSSVVKDMQLELGFGPCAVALRRPNEVPAELKVTASVLDGCSQVGLLSYQGNLTVENSIVRETVPSVDGSGGDAISVVNEKMPDGTLTVRSTLVEQATRAGISSFGAAATVEKSSIVCANFGVVAEPLEAYTANVVLSGDSLCGCDGEMSACALETPGIDVSANLY